MDSCETVALAPRGPECFSHRWCGSRPHHRVLCQTPCWPHEKSKCGAAALSWRVSTSQPHYRDLAQLAGIGRCFRCLPMPRFLVCAVLPRVPRFITVAPLALSLIEKLMPPDLKHPLPPNFLYRSCRFTYLPKRKKKLPPRAWTCVPSLPRVTRSTSPGSKPGVARKAPDNWPWSRRLLEAGTPPHTGDRHLARNETHTHWTGMFVAVSHLTRGQTGPSWTMQSGSTKRKWYVPADSQSNSTPLRIHTGVPWLTQSSSWRTGCSP